MCHQLILLQHSPPRRRRNRNRALPCSKAMAPPPLATAAAAEYPAEILEVRCVGCRETLEVERGLTEFVCPDCGTPQSLPPELMPQRPRRALPLPGRAAPAAPVAPARVACGGCGSVLSVPHGPGRFACPLCGAELASFPLAAVPVVATPAAVPISSTRFPNHSEVLLAIARFAGVPLTCIVTPSDTLAWYHWALRDHSSGRTEIW